MKALGLEAGYCPPFIMDRPYWAGSSPPLNESGFGEDPNAAS